MADTNKKWSPPKAVDSPEVLKDGPSFPKAVAKDLLDFGSGFAESAVKQIFGLSGEINLKTGQQIEKTAAKTEQKIISAEAKVRQLQYAQKIEGAEVTRLKKNQEQKIAQILAELQREVKSLEQKTAELTGEARAITVQTTPKEVGTYHLNFFEWIVGELRDIRKRVNESRMWLNLWNRKKKQKGYWNQFKGKGGIGWAMNEERSIATANG